MPQNQDIFDNIDMSGLLGTKGVLDSKKEQLMKGVQELLVQRAFLRLLNKLSNKEKKVISKALKEKNQEALRVSLSSHKEQFNIIFREEVEGLKKNSGSFLKE